MKLSIEFDDEGVIYELMDTIVTTHLKSTKASMLAWQSKYRDDVKYDKKVMAALDILIDHFGGKA